MGTVKLFHRLFKIGINASVDNEILPRNRFNKITLHDDQVELLATGSKTRENIDFEKKTLTVNSSRIIKENDLQKGEQLPYLSY